MYCNAFSYHLTNDLFADLNQLQNYMSIFMLSSNGSNFSNSENANQTVPTETD